MQPIEWTPENIRFFWSAFVIIGFLLVVGAVTSLRWLVNLELRLRARSRSKARMKYWRTAPKPSVSVPELFPKSAKEPRHPRHNGETPMRSGPGPRDWKPTPPVE